MPYDNKYNRMIADDIMSINKKYLEHEKATGQELSGGFLGAIAGALMPSLVGAVANRLFGSGEDYEGGAMSGFARGTIRDTGEGSTLGAVGGAMPELSRKVGGGKSGGVRMYKKAGKCECEGGIGFNLSGMKDILSQTRNTIKALKSDKMAKAIKEAKGGAKRRGRKSKMLSVAKVAEDMGLTGGAILGLQEGEGMTGGLVPVANMKASSMAGMGRSGGGKSKRAELVRKIMKEKNLSLPQASKYIKEHNLY